MRHVLRIMGSILLAGWVALIISALWRYVPNEMDIVGFCLVGSAFIAALMVGVLLTWERFDQ